MTDYRTKLDANGRFVLPAKVRKAMGVEPGSEVTVHFDEEAGEVRLMSRQMALQKAWALVDRYRSGSANMVDELIAERRAENAREEAKHSQPE